MNAYDKIRKALNTGDANDLLTAMGALAELERAAAEPVATVCLITDRFAHDHCIEAQLQVAPSAQLPIGTKLYTAPPVAEMERKDYALTAIIQIAERRPDCADILTIARTARLPEKDYP